MASAKIKRRCVFNDILKEKYPFLKVQGSDDSSQSIARCTNCCCNFSVATDGVSDVKKHIRTSKHTKAIERRSGLSEMSGVSAFSIGRARQPEAAGRQRSRLSEQHRRGDGRERNTLVFGC